ncbi:protein TIC [Forsythia ovata]|uniref:Protein TIC n=1 Tax=Forsythia ovata TaxID=205694 RepID=A0ABD1WKR0_9LAMI
MKFVTFLLLHKQEERGPPTNRPISIHGPYEKTILNWVRRRLSIKEIRELKENGVDVDTMVNSLNDLLACNKVVPSTPLSWEVPEELSDLFSVYLKSDPSPENLARVQYLLNISDSTAEALRAMKDRGLQNEAAEEEFVF